MSDRGTPGKPSNTEDEYFVREDAEKKRRLAQQAANIPCYICNEGNTFDVEFCHSCGAPMALAHQANTEKVCPRMIAVLGASAAGKTVYLGMLMDMLSRREDRFKFYARGAFSITLQQLTTTALARCEFPPNWDSAHR